MGEGLKIIEGRAIQCPGERIRGWVTFALMYAYSIFEFLAIHLRPLETVDVVQSDHLLQFIYSIMVSFSFLSYVALLCSLVCILTIGYIL